MRLAHVQFGQGVLAAARSARRRRLLQRETVIGLRQTDAAGTIDLANDVAYGPAVADL